MMEADKSRVEIFADFLDGDFVGSAVQGDLVSKFLRLEDGYIGVGKELRDAVKEDQRRLNDSQVLEVFQQKLYWD